MRVRCVLYQALEVIPYTLAENAGLHPIAIVTGNRVVCSPLRCAVGLVYVLWGMSALALVLLLFFTQCVWRWL